MMTKWGEQMPPPPPPSTNRALLEDSNVTWRISYSVDNVSQFQNAKLIVWYKKK